MMYNHHYWSIHMSPWLYAVYLAPLLLVLPSLRRTSPSYLPPAGEAEPRIAAAAS